MLYIHIQWGTRTTGTAGAAGRVRIMTGGTSHR